MARLVLLTVWSACTAVGFQNSMPPRHRRRLIHGDRFCHVRTLVDGHTLCRMPPG
ncbi:MAG: hypothetical protein VKK03_01700 [Synechococcus sp.]|nr:hypothetical protein [Synechococcus sp.]